MLEVINVKTILFEYTKLVKYIVLQNANEQWLCKIASSYNISDKYIHKLLSGLSDVTVFDLMAKHIATYQ